MYQECLLQTAKGIFIDVNRTLWNTLVCEKVGRMGCAIPDNLRIVIQYMQVYKVSLPKIV